MGLENVWTLIGLATIIVGAPLKASALLSYNPFSKKDPKGWAYRYNDDVKNKRNARAEPFGVPIHWSTLLWIVVAGLFTIPTYNIYHNSGTNDGWDSNPIPLLFCFLTVFYSVCWLPIYLSKCSACTNMQWAQVIAICMSTIAFIYMLDNTKIIYALMGIPMIAWNVFWWGKGYFEDVHRCGWTFGDVKHCSYF